MNIRIVEVLQSIFSRTIAVVDGVVIENKIETNIYISYSNSQDRLVRDGYRSCTRPYVQVYYNQRSQVLPNIFVTSRHFPNDKVKVKILSNGYVRIIKNYTIEQSKGGSKL